MKHFISDSQHLILSREREHEHEFVDAQSGQVVSISNSQLAHFACSEHHREILPDMTHLPKRDPDFILELQRRRVRALEENRGKRRKSRSKLDPDSPPRERKKPQSQLAKSLAGSGLSLDLQVLALQKLSKKRSK